MVKYMQIVLTKDDVLEIIKKVFDLEAVGWNKDGTVTIDTVLEKLINDKSNFNTDDLKRMLRKPVQPTPVNPTPITPSPWIIPPHQPWPNNNPTWPQKWYTVTNSTPMGGIQNPSPSNIQTTITNPAGGSVLGSPKKKLM
jgi:hypothetical protein